MCLRSTETATFAKPLLSAALLFPRNDTVSSQRESLLEALTIHCSVASSCTNVGTVVMGCQVDVGFCFITNEAITEVSKITAIIMRAIKIGIG